MEPTTYLYSKFYGWIGVIFFGGIILGALYGGIMAHDNRAWPPVGIIIVIASAILYYAIKYCFIPAINRYVALELDNEKLHCYITDRTIFWKDVVEISEDYSQYNSFIKLDMVDGSELDIPTKWIGGSTKSICNKMQEYFARTI